MACAGPAAGRGVSTATGPRGSGLPSCIPALPSTEAGIPHALAHVEGGLGLRALGAGICERAEGLTGRAAVRGGVGAGW